jgi:hypothetical protein
MNNNIYIRRLCVLTALIAISYTAQVCADEEQIGITVSRTPDPGWIPASAKPQPRHVSWQIPAVIGAAALVLTFLLATRKSKKRAQGTPSQPASAPRPPLKQTPEKADPVIKKQEKGNSVPAKNYSPVKPPPVTPPASAPKPAPVADKPAAPAAQTEKKADPAPTPPPFATKPAAPATQAEKKTDPEPATAPDSMVQTNTGNESDLLSRHLDILKQLKNKHQ